MTNTDTWPETEHFAGWRKYCSHSVENWILRRDTAVMNLHS
jgi:hypothetical protein